jgi:hypothetical protein
MDPNPRTSLKRLINNAGNPLWRNIHAHRWENNDLLIMKQGRTAERIAGFIKNNKFHVTHVFADHDDYERTLGKYSKKDFAETEFIRWEDPGDPGISEDDRDALVDERDHLLREKQALQTSLDKGKKRRKKLEKKAASLSAEIKNYLQEIEEQKAGAENLNATISRVNEENNRLKDRVESLDATISQKVEDNSRLKDRLDFLDSRVCNIENKISRLQEKPSNTPNERKFSLEGYLKKLIMGKA